MLWTEGFEVLTSCKWGGCAEIVMNTRCQEFLDWPRRYSQNKSLQLGMRGNPSQWQLRDFQSQPGFFTVSEVKVSACNAGDLGSIPGSGRFPGEGNGNSLQYSCLENPMDGGAWWATVHRVAKSRTRLRDFTSRHFSLSLQGSLCPGDCFGNAE